MLRAVLARAVVGATFGLIAACTTATPPAAPGWAQLGETATVGSVHVTPVALIEDSRCPQAVKCIWAGRVRLQARVNGQPLELTLAQPSPVAGGALMLAEVQPGKRPDRALAAGEYRFRFSFEPGR